MSADCITLSSDDEPEIETICHISKGMVVQRNTTESEVQIKEEDEDVTIISESLTKSTPPRINKANSSVTKLTISEFSSLANSGSHSLERKLSGVTVVKVDTTSKPNGSGSTNEKEDLLPSLILQPTSPKSTPLTNGVVRNKSLVINKVEIKQKPNKKIIPKKVIEPKVSNETCLPKKKNVKEVCNSDAGPSKVEEENFAGVVRRTEDLEIRGLFINLLELYKKKEKEPLMEIAQRKLWRYYRDTSTDYLKGEQFKNILKTEIGKMESVDEDHNACISMRKVLEELKSNPQIKNRKLKRLDLMLSKILKRIKQLETAEVTSDEEEDDSYVRLDRYRKRAVQIYKKICEMTDKPSDAERMYLRKISFSGCSDYPSIGRALERYYNKKRKFPDFMEVKKLTSRVVQEDKLNLLPDEIHSIAQKMFLEFGSTLQRRRRYDDYQIMVEYLDEDEFDPATKDKELLEKLNSNKKQYHKKEQEVIDEFVKKEIDLKNKKEDNDKLSKTSEDSGSNDTSSSLESDSSSAKKRKKSLEASTSSRPDFLSSDSEVEEYISPFKKKSSSADENPAKRIKIDKSDSEDMGKENTNNNVITLDSNISETEVKTETDFSNYKTLGVSIQPVSKVKEIEVTTVINLDDSDSEMDPEVTLDLEVHASGSESCSDEDGVVQLTPQVKKSESVLLTHKPSENSNKSKTDIRNTTFIVDGSRPVVLGDQTALIINPKDTKVFKRFTSKSTTNPCIVTLD